MRSNFLSSSIAITLSSVIAPAASAAIVFDSFGPGGAIDPSMPYSVSGGMATVQAVRFVSSTAANVTEVQAALRNIGGAGVSILFVSIHPEVAGQPGPSAIWTSDTRQVTALQSYTFTSASTAALAAGQAYWLVIDAPITSGNAAGAHPGQPATIGTRAQRFGNGAWTVSIDSTLPAVRIVGDSEGACCNPVTGGCALTTGAACQSLGLQFTVNGSCQSISCEACPADINRSGGLSVQDIFTFLELYFAGCP